MKIGNIVVSIFALGIVIMIIVPIPPFLLDILLVFNISLSVIILLLSIYAHNFNEFSVFPSLLLLTTLLRLGLNVSTTRLILQTGNAGNVIRAFGNFVVGGNVVTGLIMFLIIFLIQFIVITRGAERVSEVAARFTLDAMPGKQMAIDADLNTGLIDEDEAKKRRLLIQQEADFYGSMDGASKFIRGDAIVGLIIVIIDIIAGLIIGMVQKGMSIDQAFTTYTILTVGDGLVSQIPALLISTSSGILVTKSSSIHDMGEDIIKQLTQQPIVLMLGAVIIAILGLMPSLPKIPMFLISSIIGYLGYTMYTSAKEEKLEESVSVKKSEEIKKPENVLSLLQVDPIEIEFGYGIIPLADSSQGGDLLDRIVMIRRQLAVELGIIVPMIRLRDNIHLKSNEYIIKLKGIEVARGEIMFGRYLAMNPGGEIEGGGIDGIPTKEPAFGLPAIWIDENNRERAEALGYTVVDLSSVIATHLTSILRKYAYEILSRQDVQTLIDNIKESNKALVDEVIPKVISLGELQKILSNLLREGLSIRDLATILEAISDNINLTRDTDILTEYVRQSMARYITSLYTTNRKINVLAVDQDIENKILNSIQQTERGLTVSIEPEFVNNLLRAISKEIPKFNAYGGQPIILTQPIVRFEIKRLTEQAIPELVVLSYNELTSDVQLNIIGTVRV
ncbi:flagellar biosynthesis protein FlhA [Calorimonas adulescens]|uniref:Flagellar biosynthesis protein FlhA n=1 Tax=Calorimonas adulescens TaxID=2606906 RepID=A0A5D8QG09_9THEO|nr:flagellar biosynthesis protein FlhA [Calorimonas adulescens]TZE83337.1 flagellar biosynthesis protein FlhA [Calorimonas adulescens]